MYSLGWRVFRDQLGRSVPPERRRRSVLVGAVLAVVATLALVAIGLFGPWPDLGSGADLVGVALLALAVGFFGTAVVPLRPRTADGSRLYWSGAMMQAPDAVERHFRSRGAPTIDPGDRADVLREAAAVRAGMVPEVYRGVLLLVVAALATGAAVVMALPAHWAIWLAVIAVVRTGPGVVRLGRVERARALAELLPDAPAQSTTRPVRPGRPGTRTGSKLGLPGDEG